MKLAAIFLGVVVLLFLFFVVRPEPARESPGSSQDDLRHWLYAWLEPEFDFRAIPPGCFDRPERRFNVIPRCEVPIDPSIQDYRFLSLTFTDVPVTVDFQPSADDTSGLPHGPVKLDKAGDETTVVIPSKGGKLTITCQRPGPCSVQAN